MLYSRQRVVGFNPDNISIALLYASMFLDLKGRTLEKQFTGFPQMNIVLCVVKIESSGVLVLVVYIILSCFPSRRRRIRGET